MKIINFAAVITALFLITGCASSPPRHVPGEPKPYRVGKDWYQPIPDARDFRQRGVASWYGKKFHGRKTSSGEVYDMYAMTAAHKTLPLGTWVSVRHLGTGKTIKVRVNDRGPFVRGRIIDLSYEAASRIDMVGPGTAPVEVVALGMAKTAKNTPSRKYSPNEYYSGNFTFQVGAFTDRENARRLKNKLSTLYANAHVTKYDTGEETFYRVRVGRCSELAEAEEFENELINNGYSQAFIVAE